MRSRVAGWTLHRAHAWTSNRLGGTSRLAPLGRGGQSSASLGANGSSASHAGLVAAAAALVIAATMLMVAPAAHAEGCPNEQLRSENNSTNLPECRAYELASPGSNPASGPAGTGPVRAAVSGNRLFYEAYYPATNASNGSFFYLATRGESGWSTQPMTPQDGPSGSGLIWCLQSVNLTPELTKSVVGDGYNIGPGGYCNSAIEEWAPGAPRGYRNLFLGESATEGPYKLVNVTPEAAAPANAEFMAGSSDFSHIVFSDEAQLTANAPAGASLYEWADGTVHLVTVLPSGAATTGGVGGGAGSAQMANAVSADGERVFFSSQGDLYLRENAVQPQSAVNGEGHCTESEKACTIQIDESHGPGASGGGNFIAASPEGSSVLFSDESELTGDSTAAPGEPNLYEYDLQTAQLTDLTPGASGASYLSASEDVSYVYFSSPSVLTGAEENEHHERAEAGKANVYLRHAGQTTFVAGNVEAEQYVSASAVSPDGRFLIFTSRQPLTGFDNADANTGNPDLEVFRYDAQTKALSCASCSPDGSRPTADAFMAQNRSFNYQREPVGYTRRSVLDDGLVLFETDNAVVPQDSNGTRDVYEYDGAPYLVSSGADPSPTYFVDAGASGNDVFFSTAADLIPADDGGYRRIYDARVDGGFPQPAAPPTCEAEECRSSGNATSSTPLVGTALFSAPAEALDLGASKKSGIPVPHKRRTSKKRKHSKKHRREHKRHVNSNRRAGK